MSRFHLIAIAAALVLTAPAAAAPPLKPAIADGAWHADWIRRDTSSSDEYTYARTERTLSASPIISAVARISASHQYQLWMNGRLVDRGQAFSYPENSYYRTVDVSRALHGGKNAIGVLYHWYGAGQGRPASQPGLIVRVDVRHRNGDTETITTNGTWRVAAGEWLPAPLRNKEGDRVEIIDGRLTPIGWSSVGFDDSAWAPADVIGEHPAGPWRHLVAQQTTVVYHPVRPVRVSRVGSRYVADFGTTYAASPTVTFAHGSNGRRVTIRVGFALNPNGTVSRTVGGGANTNLTYGYIERYGPQTFQPFSYLGFRYLEVDGAHEAPSIAALARHNAVTATATFVSSNAMLNRVWKLLEHSTLYGMQEQFVEPTREKAQFLADSFNTSWPAMLAFGERALTAQALLEFAQSQQMWEGTDYPGRVNAVYPNGDGRRDIPDFTELYPEWVYRYWMASGDRGLVRQVYSVVAKIAAYVLGHVDPTTGLVTNLSGGYGDYAGGIVDWPKEMRYGYDMTVTARTTENALAVDVLRRTADLGDAISAPSTTGYRAAADTLIRAMNARLRTNAGLYVDGLHADGSQSTHVSQHANAYALAFGVTNSPTVAYQVAKQGMRMGPMTAVWLFEALARIGRDKAIVGLMTDARIDGWARILRLGGTYTWESWKADTLVDESRVHAWGATSLVVIQERLLGVRITVPGARHVLIEPPSGALRWARGTVPTGYGLIRVSWKRVGCAIRLRVVLPVGVDATVRLPGLTSAAAPGAHAYAGGC